MTANAACAHLRRPPADCEETLSAVGPEIVRRLPPEQRRAFRLTVADPDVVHVELDGDRATAGLASAAARPLADARRARARRRPLADRPARGAPVMRSERGQTAAEYMGVLLLVAVIIGALISAGIGGQIAKAMNASVCKIADGACEAVGIGDGPKVTSERASGRPPAADRDGDGVSNQRERELGTDPENTDTDADGLPDGEEQRVGGDPNRADSDDDGLPDAQEAGAGLNLREADTDKDGLTDAEELAAGTDPTEADGDGEMGALRDGLTDAEEIELGTDPNAYDTDGDGYPDGYEVEHGDNPVDDERSTPQKLFEDVVLDDPIGAVLPGGAGAKGARKVVDGLLSIGGKTVRRIGGAKTIKEAAEIRRERLKVLRDRLRDGGDRAPTPPRQARSARQGGGAGQTWLGQDRSRPLPALREAVRQAQCPPLPDPRRGLEAHDPGRDVGRQPAVPRPHDRTRRRDHPRDARQEGAPHLGLLQGAGVHEVEGISRLRGRQEAAPTEEVTESLTALADQLEAAGFRRRETPPDRENFGNQVIDFTKGRLRVRLVLDRSTWTIEVGDYDPDVWRAALEGVDPREPSPLDAQAEWVRANLDTLRRAARDRSTRRRLDEIATARAQHWFG